MISLALQAMATRFELVLEGDSAGARAAGEEALNEIARIEELLSLYRQTSEVAALNLRAGAEAVCVSPELFSLLERAVALSVETRGAFDLTIAPLVRCWGFMAGQGAAPADAEIAVAKEAVGYELLELNAKERTVRFLRPGMMLDFGAFGKGYAIDCAIELLREAGVEAALLHGGTSTVFGMGKEWKVSIDGKPEGGSTLAVVELENEVLSVSAVWGKAFASQGRTFGHILDARTGRPSEKAELAAVVMNSAADSDALSTALLVEGPTGLGNLRKTARGLVLLEGNVERSENW